MCNFRCFALLLVTLLTSLPTRADFQWQLIDDPASLGWSVEKLDLAEDYSKKLHTESVMIVDASGKVIRQWGPVNRAFDIFSMRKSLVSLLFGIYSEAGAIKLNATLTASLSTSSPYTCRAPVRN